MLPEAKSQDLLYVARNGANEVSVYTYPKGKFVGSLTDIPMPSGVCSDIQGNVFVVTQSQQIYEYSHAGSKPIATLDDFRNNPQGCAVDPTSNNLAASGGNGSANIAIYKNEQGTPTIYSEGSAAIFWNCTFDSEGNLFAPGSTIYELPSGGASFTSFTLRGASIGGKPGIQWDGSYLAIQGTTGLKKGPNIIYQVQISGSTATIVNQINLTDRRNNDPFRGAQFWIGNETIVSPEALNKDVGVWHYPKGGQAYRTVRVNAEGGDLTAVTVSRASRTHQRTFRLSRAQP